MTPYNVIWLTFFFLVVGKKKKGLIEDAKPKIYKTFDDDEPVTNALPEYFMEGMVKRTFNHVANTSKRILIVTQRIPTKTSNNDATNQQIT